MLQRAATFGQFGGIGYLFATTRASTLSTWLEVEASFGGEAALVAAVEGYRYNVDGTVYKMTGSKFDSFRCGLVVGPLLLRYGALRTYRTWHTETASAFQNIGLAESRQYASEHMDIWCHVFLGYFSIGLACGYEADVKCLLDAVGFSDWQGEGFELFWPSVVDGRLSAM